MDFAEQNVPFNFADSLGREITLFGQRIIENVKNVKNVNPPKYSFLNYI